MKQNIFINKVLSLSDFELSSDQKKAVDLFADFLIEETESALSIFVLSGYAGTGKSTLISLINKTLRSFKVNTRLAAPTGRAAKVLSVYANQKAQTIHKEIYFGGNALEERVKLTPAKNKQRNTLFFIDEASMIPSGSFGGDNDILSDLIYFVRDGYKCKLVFIGDIGQLPPVGQDSSPALDADFLESSFNNVQVRYAKLKQIYRTAESSSIISNATYIRNKTIFQPPFIIELDGNTQSIEGYEVQEKLEESIQAKGADNVVVLVCFWFR